MKFLPSRRALAPVTTPGSRVPRLTRGLVGAALLLLTTVIPSDPASAFGTAAPPPGPPSVNAGGYMTCGVRADGIAACWGQNEGSGNEGPGQSTPPAGVTFKEVNAGYSHACGVKTDGTVACWGAKTSGENDPKPPEGTFSHVTAGFLFSCGLRTDGTPACWGRNDAGQVGPREADGKLIPGGPPLNEVFTQLATGIRHACGLRADGTVTCWGSNQFGQGSEPPLSKMPADTTFSQITTGNFDTCGLRSSDGTAVCWGRNSFAQATTPAGAFTYINAGFGHVCGTRADQTLTCWGANNEGQATPPAGTFKHVSAGTFHSCGVTTDNKVKCWHMGNDFGRVQPLVTSNPPAPTAVLGQPYSHQFTSTYFSPNSGWAVTAGTLPPGLSLTPEGLLSGTPTKAGSRTDITVASGNGLSDPASESFGITVLGPDNGLDNCVVNSLGACVVDRSTAAGDTVADFADNVEDRMIYTTEDVCWRVFGGAPCPDLF